MREPSELRFGLVRGVGRGITVLDGVYIVQREGEVFGVFLFPHFYADDAARSIFRTPLQWVSANRVG